MKITYADHHRWVKEVPVDDSFANFGKNAQQNLKSTIHKIANVPITSKVEVVGEEFLSWFVPLYTKNIETKDNPKILSIEEKVLGGSQLYYSLALYEAGVPLGGTLFRITKNQALSIAYRTYRNDWLGQKLRANPSLYTEYLVEQFAREAGCKIIIHGRDRHPYGVNSGIGLALFKLAMGCQPYVSKRHKVCEFDPTQCGVDALVFKYPGAGTVRISEAFLLARPETAEKWSALAKYPEKITLTTMIKAVENDI